MAMTFPGAKLLPGWHRVFLGMGQMLLGKDPTVSKPFAFAGGSLWLAGLPAQSWRKSATQPARGLIRTNAMQIHYRMRMRNGTKWLAERGENAKRDTICIPPAHLDQDQN